MTVSDDRSPAAPQLARALHGVIEPLHSIVYFADEVADALGALGLEGRAQRYFAGRAAPLGPVGGEVVAALFYNFNPALVTDVLPGVWDTAPPQRVLAARAAAVEELYEAAEAPAGDLEEATALARRAAGAADLTGRGLAAANAALETPGTPFAALWQALTVLREHRGDGHVALLTARDVPPVEALVLFAAWQDLVSRGFLQRSRLWDDDAWEAAERRLAGAGWLDGQGGLTEAGRERRDGLEQRTDELAAGPWRALGAADALRLFDLLRPLLVALNDAEAFPRRVDVPDRPD